MYKTILAFLLCCLSLNNWSQFFAPEMIVLSSPHTGKGVTFDVDGDGDLDVVQMDLFGIGNLRVYYRTGSDFDDVMFPPIVGSPGSFHFTQGYADMDHDGDIDVFNGYGWAENENGQFNTSHYFLTAQHYGENAAAEDLNGDGYVDLVLSNVRNGSTYNAYHLAVLINDGAGSFTEISSYIENPINVQLGDVNHDGLTDMYYYNGSNDNWYFYPGNGDGTFDSIEIIMANIAFDSRFSDLNGDGILDFSMMSHELPVYEGDFHIFYGVPDGGYVQGPVIHLPTWELLWGSTSSWESLDYEGDGDLDILMRQYNQILWFENQNGVYTFQGKVGVISGYNPNIFWTHLNDDNRLDLLETAASLFGYTQNENHVLIPSSVACEGGCVAGTKFFMVDVDSDNDPEMLSSNGDGTFVVNKVNEFSYVSSHILGNGLFGNFWNYLDYDKDGLKDLVVKATSTVYVHRQIAPFQYDVPVAILMDIPGTTFNLDEIDVDLDGIMDLVVATDNGLNEVYWLKHINGIDYELQGLLAQLGDSGLDDINTNVFHEGDFNGDGIMDFTAVTSKTCTHFIRQANGELDIQQVYYAPGDNDVIVTSERMVSDINMDGRDDLIFHLRTMETSSKKFYTIRFDGTSFQTYLAHQFSFDELNTGYPRPVWIIGDIDADGDDDLVYSFNNQVKRCMNAVIGFSSAQFLNITAYNSITCLGWDDLDGDVMPDLLIGGVDGAAGAFVQTAINNLDSPYQINFSAFIDYNQDGIKNGFDEPLINQQIALSGNWGYAFTDEEGLYTFYGLAEDYTLTMNLDTELWTPVTPLIQNVTLSEGSPTANLIFAITPNTSVYDVQGQIITMADVCGSDYGHWISIYNAGNTTASGSVSYTLADGFTYTWGSPEPASVVGNVITWNYTDLTFNQSITYTITAASPGVESIGSTVSHTLEVTTLDGEGNLMATSFDDNTYVIECAYDPNDIRENLGWSDPGYIKDDGTLEYTIRFQNLGNAPAVDVRVENVLSGLHHHGSVVPIASSHDYVVSQDANGHLNFFYENINLPAAEDDETGSHGFITFRIKPIDGLAPNTEIVHRAHIYFDLNPPIITNEAVNTILDCESLQITMPDEVCAEEDISAQADRTEFLNYNWYDGDVALADGISTIFDLIGFGSKTILLEVSNPVCSITAEQTIEVLPAPEIMSLSNDAELCDEDVMLEVSGNGDIEWFLEGNTLATSNAILVNQTGGYNVRISNQCGFVEDVVHVNEGILPELVSISEDLVLCDESVALVADGVGEISWWYGSDLIATALEISTDEPGVYRVEAATSCGNVSQEVEVLDEDLPSFTDIYETVEFCDEVGAISAFGSEPIVWFTGDTELGTGNEIDIEEPGDYRAVMTNVCGAVEQTVHVELAESPEFSSTLENVMSCGEPVSLIAEGNGEMNWYFENGEFVGSGNEVVATQAGSYLVFLETACAIISEELIVVEGVQPVFSSFTTDASICNGSAELMADGNGDLVWFLDDDFIGEGNFIVVQNSGIYSIVLSTECGVEVVEVSVHEAENPVFETISQDIETCEDMVELEAFGSNDGDMVSWFIDGELIAEGNLFTMTATDVVEAVIDNGCASTSQEISIILNSDPVVELVWDAENQIVVATAGFESYQWTVNGVVVPDNNLNVYSPEGTEVSVIVTDENLCSGSASIMLSGISDVNKEGFFCYPNPARDIIWIEVPNNSIDQQIFVFDAFGKLVYSHRFLSGGMNQLDISQLSSGIYSFAFDNLVQKVVVE